MNYIPQNPYFSQFQNGMNNPYQPTFLGYPMQNAYTQQQPQQQPQQQTQQITTQPPILQPKQLINNEILSVANKEEAVGYPVDLINGKPSFFYNKGNGEIYLKQFDVPTGTAIFKVFNETAEQVEEKPESIDYKKELTYISEGIDNLHRMISKMQNERNYPINIDRVQAETIEIENESEQPENKSYKNKKRG